MEAAYQLSWLGWDRSGASPSSGTSLHHPGGHPMKISFEHDKIYKNDKKLSWIGAGTSSENTHWNVCFDEGVTEGGSSGGPLLDQYRRVIGQLHGGKSDCYDRTAYYGCFDVSWEGGGSKETRLKDWLSPASNMVMTTSEMKYSIVQTDEEGVYILKNYSPGVNVDWQVSSPDFYMERLTDSSVKIQPKKYNLNGILYAKVYFQGRLVGDVSYNVYSSPLVINGDPYLSAKEKRYSVNYLPLGGKLTWSVAPGMVIKEKGTDYIVVTADKSTNPWLRATVTANGTTTVKELKLHNEKLASVTMECLKTWRGTYQGQSRKKYAFRIRYTPATIPVEDLTFCWNNDVVITGPDSRPGIGSLLTGRATLITEGNIGICPGILNKDSIPVHPWRPAVTMNDPVVSSPIQPGEDFIPYLWEHSSDHAVAVMPSITMNEESDGYVSCKVTDATGAAFPVKSPDRLFDKWDPVYHVSPNPVAGVLTIVGEPRGESGMGSSASYAPVERTINLFSNTGLVRSVCGNSDRELRIDTSGLPDGNYTLTVLEEGKTVHSHVVLIKH